MNKIGLIEVISKEARLTKKETRHTLDALIKTITDVLSNGEKVTLVGFGTFQVLNRKERRGRNPQTGEELQIPAKKVPKFKAGKDLREKVG